jgi:hypothetical protein
LVGEHAAQRVAREVRVLAGQLAHVLDGGVDRA